MPDPASQQTDAAAEREAQVHEGHAIVAHADGLHARPAASLVKLAKSFASDVEIECRGKTANAKSAVRIMLLAVKADDEVILRVRGADAAEAFARIFEFLQTDEKPWTPNAPAGAV